jgi:hypothetical protein
MDGITERADVRSGNGSPQQLRGAQVNCVLLALIFARLLNLNHKKRRPPRLAHKMTTPASLPPAITNRLTVLV